MYEVYWLLNNIFFQKLIELLDLFTLYLLLWSNLSVNILLANQVDGQFTLPTWQAEWRLQPADPAPPPSCPAPPSQYTLLENVKLCVQPGGSLLTLASCSLPLLPSSWPPPSRSCPPPPSRPPTTSEPLAAQAAAARATCCCQAPPWWPAAAAALPGKPDLAKVNPR